MFTIREVKFLGIKKLLKPNKSEAAIDAEILLAHVLGISREELLTHDERPVTKTSLNKFNKLIARRIKHEPIAYLTGHKDFFALRFNVNKHTLIPRPETELLVEEALYVLKTTNYKLVTDIGTGSGAIAVALAKNAPNTKIIATDISSGALKLAQKNAQENKVDKQIVFEKSNLLPKKNVINFNELVITANLPYLPTKVWAKCAPNVKRFEPKTALVAGADGLKYYKELFKQINVFLKKETGYSFTLICEIDPSQKKSFPVLAKTNFKNANVLIKKDLAKLPRLAVVTVKK